jgi:photosystem II stability/assembly factor-like uncharacterized protein
MTVVAAANPLRAGPIYISTNSGADWSVTSAPILNWYSIACSADGTKLVAAAYGRGIYTSGDAGVTWVSNNIPPIVNGAWESVSLSADGLRAFAVPRGNYVMNYTTNFGTTWQRTTNNLADLICVAASADGTFGVASDTQGRTATTTNLGGNWSVPVKVSPMQGTWVVHLSASADGRRLLSAAMFGGVYSSTNGGLTWTSNSLPSNSSWYATASSADGSRLTAAAQKGLVYSSTNSGATWESNSAPGLIWQSAACSADGNVVFAAPSNGEIWVRRTIPNPRLNIVPTAPGPLLSWIIPSADFKLQRAADLVAPHWINVTNVPVLNLTNLQNQVTVPWGGKLEIYRLRED